MKQKYELQWKEGDWRPTGKNAAQFRNECGTFIRNAIALMHYRSDFIFVFVFLNMLFMF